MSIDKLRQRIDKIDEDILALLNERAKCAISVGAEKKELNLQVGNAEREHQIFKRLSDQNPGPLMEKDIEIIFSNIITVCRNLQK